MNANCAKVLEKYGIEVIIGYGITECSPVISVNNIIQRKHDSVGFPLPNVNVFIENKDKYNRGEIVVSTPSLFLGYIDETDSKDNNVFYQSNTKCFATGDLGYIGNDGHIYMCGRLKNMILLRNGENVYPEYLEDKLMEIDGIEEAYVYTDDLHIIADVRLISGEKYSKENIMKDIKILNEKLPEYSHIQKLNVVDCEFDKTVLGKLKRN